MNPLTLAYILMGLTLIVMEGFLRPGKEAKRLKPGKSDHGSSILILTASCIIIFVAPLFSYTGIGELPYSKFISWMGIAVMIFGMVIRFWAMKTLGKFYTHILLVSNEQHIVKQGMYKIIRHPGYLGFSLIYTGFGLTTANWVSITIVAISNIVMYGYRIKNEEHMLIATFGDEYLQYMKSTYRIIPFIF